MLLLTLLDYLGTFACAVSGALKAGRRRAGCLLGGRVILSCGAEAGTGRRVDGMKCSILGCPGECEQRTIVHTVRHHGEIIVIDHVPAEICSVCGDVLLAPDTIRHIEKLLQHRTAAVSTAPLYEYA